MTVKQENADHQDLLVEIGVEELPPKALRALRDAFVAGIDRGLTDARLAHGQCSGFASPRRLAVLVSAVADRQDDRDVEQKGPPVSIAFDENGQPTKAGQAFAAKCGVDIDSLQRQKGKGGEWLMFRHREKGESIDSIAPLVVQAALDALPIPRRMRWGDCVGDTATEFVRPVHWVVLMHGSKVIPATVLGIDAGNRTRGHRFHAPEPVEIGKPSDYESLLRDQYVVADIDKRLETIRNAVKAAAEKAGGHAVGDAGLYDEVCALTEWPVALTGSFDKQFLELPPEVIVATLTGHQRYFPVHDDDNTLLPVFITVSNLESRDPDTVRDGNERVIRPRLADAKFFWDADRKLPLGERVEALKSVVYQKGLGSLHDKSMRVTALASLMAESVGANQGAIARSAVLAKCDLLSGMVGEFPELQGIMGAYYAAGDESGEVATAIREHYLPRFAGDKLPESIAGQLLAIADKLDTIAGIFLLGKKPTGNRDPFGLRRAALGVVRILAEKQLDLNLMEIARAAVVQQPLAGADRGETSNAVYDFLMERFRNLVVEGDDGVDADTFEAVRAQQPKTLPEFRSKLDALLQFMQLDAAKQLAAANKRCANILKKAGVDYRTDGQPDTALFEEDAERVLFHAMSAADGDVAPLMEKRAYSAALRRLAELQSPIDSFFDGVMVMADDEAVRKNRLAMLAAIRRLFLGVADLSRLNLVQE